MSRSTHVMASCWKGGLALVAAAVMLVGGCYFDLLGIASRVPEPATVEQVVLSLNNGIGDTTLSSAEGLDEACTLHRDILDARIAVPYGSIDGSGFTIALRYELKDGSTFERSYPIVCNYYEQDSEPADEGTKLVNRLVALADTPEGRASRYAWLLDNEDGRHRITLEYETERYGEYASVTLSATDSDDLLQHALRQDWMEEAAGSIMGDPNTYYEGQPNVYLYFADVHEDYESYEWGFQVRLETAPHAAAWVKEHYPEAWVEVES